MWQSVVWQGVVKWGRWCGVAGCGVAGCGEVGWGDGDVDVEMVGVDPVDVMTWTDQRTDRWMYGRFRCRGSSTRSPRKNRWPGKPPRRLRRYQVDYATYVGLMMRSGIILFPSQNSKGKGWLIPLEEPEGMTLVAPHPEHPYCHKMSSL